MATFILVDCEARGISPVAGTLTEFGAVELFSDKEFHGKIWEAVPDPSNPAIPVPIVLTSPAADKTVFYEFRDWLDQFPVPLVFVSDNPAFDWQWISAGFALATGENPFGHSARRIGDFYAGQVGNWKKTQEWKKLRVTPHTHNPVDDARGNREALLVLLERQNAAVRIQPK